MLHLEKLSCIVFFSYYHLNCQITNKQSYLAIRYDNDFLCLYEGLQKYGLCLPSPPLCWGVIDITLCSGPRCYIFAVDFPSSHVLHPASVRTMAGIILCMHPANERRRYNVTSSLIGWAHSQTDPCLGGRLFAVGLWCVHRAVQTSWMGSTATLMPPAGFNSLRPSDAYMRR